LWGQEEHVRALLGDQVHNLASRRETVRVDRFDRPEDFRDYFRERYGPVAAVYRGVADDPDRLAALDRDIADLARMHDRGTTSTVMEWEYLLLTAQVHS